MNGKTRLSHSEQSILITKNIFTHQVTATFIASWLLIHFLVSWWHTRLWTLEHKLLYLLLRNGYILSEFFILLYTTEALFSSLLTSLTGLKNCESLYEPEQHTRLDDANSESTHRPLLAKRLERRWKHLVISGNEIRLRSQYKCQLQDWKHNLQKIFRKEGSNQNVSKARTPSQQTETLLFRNLQRLSTSLSLRKMFEKSVIGQPGTISASSNSFAMLARLQTNLLCYKRKMSWTNR